MTRKDKKADRLARRRIGQNIAARRVELDITQAELARRMEVNVSEVAALESGSHQPMAETLQKVAGSLDWQLTDLLDGVRWVVPAGPDENGRLEVERRRR